MANYTQFEVGKNYLMDLHNEYPFGYIKVNVLSRNENKKTLIVVEEYETMQFEIPYKRYIDRYGNVFERATYLGDYMYSNNIAKQ